MKMPQAIREFVALDAGDSDVWGWANGHMFGIAETLYAAREPIPDDWEFRCPWPPETRREHLADSWPDSEYFDMFEHGYVTADELRTAGEVMRRYIRLCQRHAKDY